MGKDTICDGNENEIESFRQRGLNSIGALSNFIGNLLTPRWQEQYENKTPEEIAKKVLEVMVREVDLFEEEKGSDGTYHFKLRNNHLIPKSEAVETDKVPFELFEDLYLRALRGSLPFQEFSNLVEPLKEKAISLDEADDFKETLSVWK